MDSLFLGQNIFSLCHVHFCLFSDNLTSCFHEVVFRGKLNLTCLFVCYQFSLVLLGLTYITCPTTLLKYQTWILIKSLLNFSLTPSFRGQNFIQKVKEERNSKCTQSSKLQALVVNLYQRNSLLSISYTLRFKFHILPQPS